jgi:hypothetical protein
MYLGVGLVAALIMICLSPGIWIASWLLADPGRRADESPAAAGQAGRKTGRAA